MRLSQGQRQHLAEMFREVANLIMAAVVISSLVEEAPSFGVLIATLVMYGIVVILTTWLRKGR